MDSNYWSSRYQNKKTRWDLGKASPPLIEIFRHIDENAKILVCKPCAESRKILQKNCLKEIIFGGMNDFHKASSKLNTRVVCY